MDARELWRDVRALDVPIDLRLGPNTAHRYLFDPKRLAFFLSRYKFAARMLHDCTTIADIGSGDGFGLLTFCNNPHVTQIHGYDFDEQLVDYAQHQLSRALALARPDAVHPQFYHGDFLTMKVGQSYDGVVSLDVIEHIDPDRSQEFLGRIYEILMPCGIAVIGTPNEYAAQYGSPHSRLGHVNNYGPERLRAEMSMFFPITFLFSCNDEVVHTGFDKLAHYLIAVGVKPGFNNRKPRW